MNHRKPNKNNNGFTLIEVIVSMAILGIILVAFLNMFSFAMIGMFRARDKSAALNKVQGAVESQLANGDAFHSDEMVLTFGGQALRISGGHLDTSMTVGSSGSQIKGFIPYIPTIETFPKTVIEGATPGYEITVKGNDTHFSVNTRVEIFDRELFQILYNPVFTKINPLSGSFKITSNLVNQNGDYIVRVSTVLPDGSKEVSRSKLTVFMPRLVAVTSDAIYVSEYGEKWVKRDDDALYPLPAISDLEKVIYAKGEYITAGGTSLLRASDFSPWVKSSVSGVSQISGITYSNGNYYISTETGLVLRSANGTTWTTLFFNGTYKFNEIHSTGDGKVIAVGKDSNGHGIIVHIDNNGFVLFTLESGETETEFNGISSNSSYDEITKIWSHSFAVVGSNGYIFTSTNGKDWVRKVPIDQTTLSEIVLNGITLNAIYYAGSSMDYTGPAWIAVGDSGVFLESSDLTNWSKRQVGNKNLNSVYVTQKRVFIAGNGGTIIRSGENNLNQYDIKIVDVLGADIKSIIGR